jgi:hypothetical protein
VDGGWSVHVLTSLVLCLAAGEGRKAVEAGGKQKCLRKNKCRYKRVTKKLLGACRRSRAAAVFG